MIVHKNVLNSFLVNNCRLGRVDTSPPSLIFNNNNMALQVWLPLNKSGADKNQGLANINIVNNASYEVSGKLGGCYKNGTINSGWGKDYNACLGLSASCWINIPTVEGNAIILGSVHNYPANTRFYVGCYNGYFSGGFGNTTWGDAASNRKIESGTWYHLCMTTFGTNWKLYINGQCVQEKTSSENPVILYGNIYIGEKQALYNDFRIYDHCLSPKEVKEISKGLVLHYPLNDAYVQSTTNLNKSIGTTWANWGTNTIIGDSFISPEGTTGSHIKCSSFTDGGICTTHSSFSVKPDTTYVISAKMKVTGSAHRNLFYWREYNSSKAQLSENGKWSATNVIEYGNGYKLYYGIITTASTASSVTLQSYFYGSGEHWIYDIQVEEGQYPTPFTGYNTSRIATTVYDCSGYQNNGTISGSLICSTDSPRYKTCIETNASQIIHAPIGNGIPSSDLTVACWIKRPETIDSNTMRCWLQPNSGNNQRFYFRILPQGNTVIFNIGFGANGYGNKTVDTAWHHLAATTSSDGKTISVYVDGILTNTGTEENAFNLAGDLKLATNFIGKMSDFRFYRTALSAEDIKELYNTSCIINS